MESEFEEVNTETKKDDTLAGWTEVKQEDSSIHKFEEKGDILIGELIETEKDVGENKSKLYTLQYENGDIVKFWGSKILDDRLIAVKLGTTIKVEYLGWVKPDKGREYKDFKVYVKK